jgi:hypothetical protein
LLVFAGFWFCLGLAGFWKKFAGDNDEGNKEKKFGLKEKLFFGMIMMVKPVKILMI